MGSGRVASAATLVLIHTVAPLISEFARWCAEMAPDLNIYHVLDEPLLERIRRRGEGRADDAQRLLEHLEFAVSLNADVVLVTCSTVSLLVDSVRDLVDVPVIKIDEAMAAEAVRSGPRIALIATNETTLEPSMALILGESDRAGLPVEIRVVVVPDALAALLNGDEATHDQLVANAIVEAVPSADVIVLAQASMARATTRLDRGGPLIPVLTSPELALREVVRALALSRTDPLTPREAPVP